MSRPAAVQVERAKRLLATEGDLGGSAAACAAAAGRVYDQLDTHLSRLLGSAGVRALFARSAKVAQAEAPRLAQLAGPGGSAKLRECLEALEPAAASEAAALLFGTFLDLMTTFVGERLTVQALRRAWPTLE